MQIEIIANEWESEFFNFPIGKVVWQTEEKSQPAENFTLLQAKVASGELEKIALLQKQGFQLVEGEVDFCVQLDFAKLGSNLTACIATEQDIPALQSLFGEAFPTSRFRPPYFSAADNARFYQTWIAKAVKGEFDTLCLLLKQDEKLQGAISLRLINDEVRVGLLAVAPCFQGQGVAKKLLQQALVWAKEQAANRLWVATQISNLPAINLYQSFGAKVASTSYWFYKSQ